MTGDAADLTATQLLAAYRAGDLSPTQACDAVLDRIEAVDPVLNAYRLVDADRARKSAAESTTRWLRGEPAGLLDGVPASIKDLLLTEGWPTLRGSRAISPDQPWSADSPAVARLREHGAVLVGKTTTPELGWKGLTDSPLTGITRNPWDPTRTPGGSSGGAAAAVAAGMAPLAVGTDGGGADSGRLHGDVHAEAHLWPGAALSGQRVRHARAHRPHHAHGRRRVAHAAGDVGARLSRLVRPRTPVRRTGSAGS
jgi:aspartyl-tRNA(Asn)/glutamyl-tRNA(Gln) amidotransferase subunit A